MGSGRNDHRTVWSSHWWWWPVCGAPQRVVRWSNLWWTTIWNTAWHSPVAYWFWGYIHTHVYIYTVYVIDKELYIYIIGFTSPLLISKWLVSGELRVTLGPVTRGWSLGQPSRLSTKIQNPSVLKALSRRSHIYIKIPFQNQLWGNPRTKWSFIAGTSNKTPDFHGQAFRLTRKGWAEAADVGTPKRLWTLVVQLTWKSRAAWAAQGPEATDRQPNIKRGVRWKKPKTLMINH